MSERLRWILTEGLQIKVRQQYDRLLDAMLRDLNYLEQTSAPVLQRATQREWNQERIRVVLMLNAFHRIVIGPLEAAFGVELLAGLGHSTPITYGQTLRIDSKSGAPTRKALAAYHRILKHRELQASWLSMTRVSDVLFAMGGDEEERFE